jgi:PhnB protein
MARKARPKASARKKAGKAAKKAPARKAAGKKVAAKKVAKKVAAKRAPARKPAARQAAPGISAIPYLVISNAAKAIDFYRKAFGAEELFRMPAPDGSRLMHATIKIGDAPVMMSDEFPEYGGNRGPDIVGGTTVSIHLNVPDVDKAFAKAVEAGANVIMPLADMFWGDRYGKVRDPFGHEWSLATHKRDVSPAEMQKAMKEQFAKMGKTSS